MNEHDRLVDRAARDAHTVLFVGGLDAGKSTLARAVSAYALTLGRSVAYVDGDLGQKTVGPPGTVAMKRIGSADDLTLDRLADADALSFVGSFSPQGHLLPLVTGIARLHDQALADGADLVVVDTSGMVSGIYGQLVKYHKVELLQPDLVVGLQRGEELAPVLGVIERFFSVDVVSLGVHPSVVPTSVEQRAEHRQQAMARYFRGAQPVPDPAHGVHAQPPAPLRAGAVGSVAGGALRRARGPTREWATSSTCPTKERCG